jgi:hypothetical protein
MLMALIKLDNKEARTIVEAGDVVDLGLLASTLGVVIYSPAVRQAYAANLIAVEEDLEKIAFCALNRFGAAANLEAYLAGLSLDSDLDEDVVGLIAEERRIAKEILLRRAFDPAKLRIRWGPQDAYTWLIFDPAKGEATLKIIDYLGKTVYAGGFDEAPLFIN